MTCNCTGACRRPPYTCGGYVGPMPVDWIYQPDHFRKFEWYGTLDEPAPPANPPASPTPFLLGLVVGCVLGGDFVWIVGQLFNGN